MAKEAVAIRHIDFEDLGFFDETLRAAGFAIRYVDAGRDELRSDDIAGAPLLVVLGGPMSVYEEERYPFLADEIGQIGARIDAGRPVLGICLGAQLIARALGARVYPGDSKEIGFGPITLTAAGNLSPLHAIASGQPVLHWHGDTFDLPRGAELLASTSAYENQAFSVGPSVLALQFHLEAGHGIERWLIGHAAELRAAGIDPESIRRGANRHAPALRMIADTVLTSWLAAANG